MKVFSIKPLYKLLALSVILAVQSIPQQAFSQTASTTETIVVDSNSKTKAFPHFWEQMFGSERAIVTLRESYRKDLKKVKEVTDFKYVRPHAIFHDETGIYDEDANGKPVYNFTYIDQIYDGLLENGVTPFVELSFMPRKMAEKLTEHPFWYKQITSPPKDWSKWEDLIYNFTKHLQQRYGEAEVSKWYFEVWNEPNIDFWSGDPKEETYYELYDRAAKSVKKVSKKFRVGGPGTAQAAWVDKFINHCVSKNIPVDFVTTHVYANDSAKDVFGTNENIPRKTMVARSVDKVYNQVKHSAKPQLPIIWSEYNASYKNEVEVTDSPFMGPWIANNIRQCDGKANIMSYWTFSDVFEEQGVTKTPFYGGFGLIATGNIPKASYNAFKMLHNLGTQRLSNKSESVLVTKKADNSVVLAAWNYFEPEVKGTNKQIKLVFKSNKKFSHLRITQLDKDHGSSLTTWESMGKPAFPSRVQQIKLRNSGELPPPEIRNISAGRDNTINLNMPPHSLFLIEELR